MKTITVNTKQETYTIFIGSNLLTKLDELVAIKDYSKIAIITDTNVAKFHLQKLQESLHGQITTIILEPGEKAKTITTTERIWQQLAEAKFDRKSLVINLGGGVIGDMGGFAASTYMRGIAFINIPTTILAQVDESVGGKTGIDFNGVKNLIGTFEQPKAVVIDIETIKTLPDREFHSGFAEIIKHGLIADASYFNTVTAKQPRDFSDEELITIIARSCEIKRDIIEEDTHEKGTRKLVNFGHTIGHALEALSLETDSPLMHGEAVSIGMVAEAKLSELKGYLSTEELTTVKTALQNANLPITSNNVNAEKITEKIASDKKNVAGKVNWTLLKGIGKAQYDEEAAPELVQHALASISND